MGPRCALLVLTSVALLSAGCHSLNLRATPNYETVAADPRHDSKEARAKCERGAVLMEKGHLEKAEKHFQEALVADVTYGPAHNNLGSLYLQRGEFYLAAWEFEYAIKLMRDRAEPYNNLGMVYEAVGRYDDAVRNYELACRNEPRSPEYLGNLARVQVRRGDQPDVVRPLLEQLIFVDTRPDWVCWAREYLALHNPKDQPANLETPINSSRTTVPEDIPRPTGQTPAPEPLPTPRSPDRNVFSNPRSKNGSGATRIASQHQVSPKKNTEGSVLTEKPQELIPSSVPTPPPEE